MKIIKQLTTLLLLAVPSIMSAQTADRQVIASTGGYFTAGSITASVTVGETMVETFEADITLTQGFQQTDQLWPLGVEAPDDATSVSVFPNPAMDELSIQLDDSDLRDFSISLYDLHGKVLLSESSIATNVYKVDMRAISAGFYVLQIKIDGEPTVQTVKIEKTF